MTLEQDKKLLKLVREEEEKRAKRFHKFLEKNNFDMSEDSARNLLELVEEFLEEEEKSP